MKKVLKREFFNRPTPEVAHDLLGKYLVRRFPSGEVKALMITETEAYDGFHDKASHASRGETKRNKIMFGSSGYWYVYFTYGMHWMLNIVTREKGYPAAVLIRGVEGAEGPARLTKKLQINKEQNEKKAESKSGLWIEDRGVKIPKNKIKKTGRIGIQYAGPYWMKRRWRFYLPK
jgi:DNA-3-methyladenine glycosylase